MNFLGTMEVNGEMDEDDAYDQTMDELDALKLVILELCDIDTVPAIHARKKEILKR